MISRKRPPTGVDERVIQTIYDDLNELIDAMNKKPVKGDSSNTEGKAGDIRLSKQADNTYALQMRFEEGWVTSAKNVFQLQGIHSTTPTLVAGSGAGLGQIPIELTSTGITPGDYTSVDITVGADGRIYAIANGSGGGGGITHPQVMSRSFIGAF